MRAGQSFLLLTCGWRCLASLGASRIPNCATEAVWEEANNQDEPIKTSQQATRNVCRECLYRLSFPEKNLLFRQSCLVLWMEDTGRTMGWASPEGRSVEKKTHLRGAGINSRTKKTVKRKQETKARGSTLRTQRKLKTLVWPWQQRWRHSDEIYRNNVTRDTTFQDIIFVW